MSNKKQSSIGWLESAMNRIMEKNNIEVEKIIWEQAKAMHQKELEDAYDQKVINDIQNWSIRSGKHYYELHYKKNEN